MFDKKKFLLPYIIDNGILSKVLLEIDREKFNKKYLKLGEKRFLPPFSEDWWKSTYMATRCCIHYLQCKS
jgi:hypothetical protein